MADRTLQPLRDSRAAATLAATALLAPLWNGELVRLPVGVVTVGRLLVLACLVGCLVDLAQGRISLKAQPRLAWALMTLVAAFGVLAAVSSKASGGCDCASSISGYAELAPVLLVALAALASRPNTARPLLGACFAGSMVAAAAAAMGAGPIGPVTEVGAGRLAGTYGNANELGYILAFAPPIAVAFAWARTRRGVLVALTLCALPVAVLLLSFSRGSLISAAAGTLAAFVVVAVTTRRGALTTLAVTVAAVALAGIAYPLFLDARIEASFGSAGQTPTVRDLSGWDAGALGLPAMTPTQLSNDRAGNLRVVSSRSGQGVSFPLGRRAARTQVYLRFEARAESDGIPFSYGFKGISGKDAVSRTALLDRRWRDHRLAWRLRDRVPEAALYFWQSGGPSAFAIRNVKITSRTAVGQIRTRRVALALKGTGSARSQSLGEREESRYVDTRMAAAELAVEEFADNPLRGIGWDRFPERAAERLQYGRLATHNEYLRVAAELGLPGVVLGFAGMALLAAAATGIGRSRVAAAAVGILVTTAVGQLFANGIVFAEASVPAVIAAAIVVSVPRATE